MNHTAIAEPVTKFETKPEIVPLTGVRAFAAWWVVLYHLRVPLEHLCPALRWVLDFGYLGVDLFFILSGFILAYNYLHSFRVFQWNLAGRFLFLRLSRIYPVHLFTLLVVLAFLAVGALLGHQSKYPEQFTGLLFLRQLLLVHAWTIPTHFSWNGPAWSISCEWLAYLAFPFLAGVLVKITRLRTYLLLLGAALLLPGVFTLFFRFGGQIEYGLLRICCEFSAGCLLFCIFNTGFLRRINYWSSLILAALACLLGAAIALQSQNQLAFFTVPLIGIMIYGLACSNGRVAQWVGRFSFWGRASFSLYMVQFPVILFFAQLLPAHRFNGASTAIQLTFCGVQIGAMALASVLCYLFVEEPSRKYLRSVSKRFDAAKLPICGLRSENQAGQESRAE